jgi:1,4-dihydroxy-2-naphthoate octaprenyltransferase
MFMLKAWLIAMRPWSFTAAFVPVAVGTALAWSHGFFNPILFVITALGGIAVQAGTNLINTYGDYRSGVDTVASASTCPQLVTGAMQPEDMRRAGLFAFAFAAVIGLVLSWLCGWEILAVGFIGILSGYSYTAGPFLYKYKGLGSILVFFLMGPLMAWPAWFIQTGYHSWTPILTALPIACLVSAILNGNDVRDIAHDRAAGIITLVTEIGFDSGLYLQQLLYWGAFISLLALAALKIVPVLALLPFILLPVFRKNLHTIKKAATGNPQPLLQLEAMAAQFHFQFGILFAAGFILQPWLAGKGF